jgi:hypothetical protein
MARPVASTRLLARVPADLSKAVGVDDPADQRLDGESTLGTPGDDLLDRQGVGRHEFASEGVAEEMCGEGPCEAPLLRDDGSLERDRACEVMHPEERSAGIDRTAIVVVVSPPTGDVVVLEGEAERIEPRVAAGAGGVLPMRRELLADREVRIGRGLFEGGDIGRGGAVAGR